MITRGVKTWNDRSVQETEQYLHSFLPLIRRTTVLSPFTTAGVWSVFFFFLLYGGSQTYKCITTIALSNGPLTLYLQSQLGASMVRLRKRWWSFKIKPIVSCLYTSVLPSWAAVFHLGLSVYVFSLKAVGPIDWHYNWQTATVWVNLRCVLLKKQSHLHLGCPGGKQINITFSFLSELSL